MRCHRGFYGFVSPRVERNKSLLDIAQLDLANSQQMVRSLLGLKPHLQT